MRMPFSLRLLDKFVLVSFLFSTIVLIALLRSVSIGAPVFIFSSTWGQTGQVWRASKTSRPESFYTSSTCEMDNSTLTHDALGASTSVKSSEFANNGLLLWNQSRKKWIGNKKPQNRPQQLLLEPKLSWNATYDSLLSSNKPFHKPIPLGEMVDFLVDVWEQEGMLS